jgi:hypothetical protein
MCRNVHLEGTAMLEEERSTYGQRSRTNYVKKEHNTFKERSNKNWEELRRRRKV